MPVPFISCAMTRATYSFLSELPAPAATTLYLTMDGYPEGAANYLRAMLAADEGCSAVAFIRANQYASLVSGHQVYHNTSYRYTLSEAEIVVEERLEVFKDGWKTLFSGSLLDFINSQPGHMMHHVALYPDGRKGYYTLAQLVSFVNVAEREVMAVAAMPGATGIDQAKRRVEELKAVVVAAYRVEEPELVA